MKDEDAVLQLAAIADVNSFVDVCALADDAFGADHGFLANLSLMPHARAGAQRGAV